MVKQKLLLIISILFTATAGFMAFNFWGLCLNEGELLIVEPVAWVRWLEFIGTSLLTISGLACVFWAFFEYIGWLRRHGSTSN